MSAQQLLTKEETLRMREQYHAPNVELFFKSQPLKIIRAKGQYMYDEKGEAYLDCINNVAHVGHCHDHVNKAASDQMSLLNTNCRFLHDNLVLYAKKLTSYLPEGLSVCFFTNSGSESNDLALQLARKHTGRRDVVCLEQAYHGTNTSTMEISDYKSPAGDALKSDWAHVASVPEPIRGRYAHLKDDPQAMTQAYVDEVKKLCEDCESEKKPVAAFICESFPSCAGQIVFPPGYLKSVYWTVRSHGGVCIADEVQSGFGRVGEKFWAFELHGVTPDIVTLGKPIGNGYPLSAVVTTRQIAESFGRGGRVYFNTFGGNPVAMAVGLAVLEVVEREQLQKHALEVGNYLMDKLRELQGKHEYIGDVRGKGLFIGVDLVKSRACLEPAVLETQHLLSKLKERHILLNSDGKFRNVLKFKPPMCFSKADADRVCSAIDQIMTEMKKLPREQFVNENLHLSDMVAKHLDAKSPRKRKLVDEHSED